MSDARHAIPSVERLLASPALAAVLADASRARVTETLRAIQEEQRASNSTDAHNAEWYAAEVRARLQRADAPSLVNVINATGVVLHTNLGRAPLAPSAMAAIARVASGYSNLEYDVETGQRGSRYDHCATLLQSLTGAQAALVVNNNAAALVLALNTLARGRGVLISRGELVEIGDSFRIAEIVERSGATLREVGATNRTHVADYQRYVADASAILKVHPSNYRTSGFVAEVAAGELAGLAKLAGIPLIYDLGSGLLESLEDLGLPHEPTARDALAAGADLVTMSGDKLLGGPQAGIIIGRADLITAMKRNPLCRALRVDKLTLAALEATLQCYNRGTARQELPVLRMLAASPADIEQRGERLAAQLRNHALEAEIIAGASAVGGGAYPAVELPTALVALRHHTLSAHRLEELLRTGAPALLARIADGRVVLDLRTVLPEDDAALLDRILRVV
ncbi:MAG TPA: L-seryl-tRNA(Sec) selenium transferase [Longimicrobiales bacterium]